MDQFSSLTVTAYTVIHLDISKKKRLPQAVEECLF